MKKYRCEVCDYIYDPVLGDPENGIEPGTSFDSLPDEWICPVCGGGNLVQEVASAGFCNPFRYGAHVRQ